MNSLPRLKTTRQHICIKPEELKDGIVTKEGR